MSRWKGFQSFFIILSTNFIRFNYLNFLARKRAILPTKTEKLKPNKVFDFPVCRFLIYCRMFSRWENKPLRSPPEVPERQYFVRRTFIIVLSVIDNTVYLICGFLLLYIIMYIWYLYIFRIIIHVFTLT